MFGWIIDIGFASDLLHQVEGRIIFLRIFIAFWPDCYFLELRYTLFLLTVVLFCGHTYCQKQRKNDN